MQEFSSSAELERVRGIAESARLAADRVQRQVNALDSEMSRYERRGIRSFIAVVVLLALTAGGAWWFNTRLTEQESSIAKVVGAEGLLQRLSGAETLLKNLPTQWSDVTTRVETLDKTVSETASKADLEKRIGELNERIAALQAQNRDDGTELASLRDQLSAARRASSQPAAAIPRRQESITPPVNPPDRTLRDFQVMMERAAEVVPGVLLSIKETDVEQQQVNGWVYLQEQRRFVYLKNQGLGKPITVHDIQNKESHDIVFTQIRENNARGYISSPKTPVSVSAAN
jgi:chaperonin cofactor prefoldin